MRLLGRDNTHKENAFPPNNPPQPLKSSYLSQHSFRGQDDDVKHIG